MSTPIISPKEARDAFVRVLGIFTLLKLGEVDCAKLLGMSVDKLLLRFADYERAVFTRHECERLSAMHGIIYELRARYAEDQVITWLNTANITTPFHGKTPLAHMMQGNNDGLFQTWRHVMGLEVKVAA